MARIAFVILVVALAVLVVRDPGVPVQADDAVGKPISQLCCPQGAFPTCWCDPTVRADPPCEPPATLGAVPGVPGEWCRVMP